MNQASVAKLVKKGVDRDVAKKLVTGGMVTPRSIRLATKTRLREITGLSPKKVGSLKELFEPKK